MKTILLYLALITASVAAETVSQETITVTKTARSWHIEVSCEFGEPYRITFHREIVTSLADKTVVGRQRVGVVTRKVGDILTSKVTLPSGKVLTGTEVAQALEAFSDKLATEDAVRIAAEAARIDPAP